MEKRIANLVLEKWNQLKPEKTCVCGIVMKVDEKLELVALGTGVKCLSKNKIDSFGVKVRDSHAEIICKRGFQRFILLEIIQCKKGLQSIVVEESNRFEIKKNVEFYFYSSMPPCGDASMQDLDAKQSDAERAENERKRLKFTHQKNENGVIRGRLNFERIGSLRTKPARGDAIDTLSKSCSDKLAKLNFLGIGGAFISFHLKPIYFKMMVFGNTRNVDSLQRSLVTRLENVKAMGDYKINQPVITCLDEAIMPNTIDPNQMQGNFSPVSVCWHQPKSLEYLVNGLKQGANTKTAHQPQIHVPIFLNLVQRFQNLRWGSYFSRLLIRVMAITRI